MTQGRACQTHGRENGHDHIARHRPRGTAARRRWILLQTQDLSRKGGWLAGIIRRLTAGALPWAVAEFGAIGDRTRREVYDRHIVPRPFAGHTVFCQAKIATSRPHTLLAATQIDAGATCPSGLRHASPRTVGPYGWFVEDTAAVGDVRRVCARRGRPVLGASRTCADRARHPAHIRADSCCDLA